jgi:hypothetical protein
MSAWAKALEVCCGKAAAPTPDGSPGTPCLDLYQRSLFSSLSAAGHQTVFRAVTGAALPLLCASTAGSFFGKATYRVAMQPEHAAPVVLATRHTPRVAR